jgi:type IV pilus assembly protein PilQ
LASLLKSWVGGGALTKRGNILVDDRTNTLIISDIQSQVPIIDSIITKLDKKAKQVYIEARIVRVNADFVRNLAGALTVGTANTSGSTITAGATGSGSSVTTSTEERSITVTQATAGGFGVYAVSNAGAKYIINAAISAAETKSQAKTISSPAIVTQNNVPGSVLQGTQIPIQTSINNTISIQYVQASLELKVTPQVTEDGNIFLVINVRNASPGAILSQAGPSINTQEATTQVLVPDGGTVVFGGVNVTGRSKSATYVPLLGSIPILGHLFKSSNVTDSDQQLLFFVSPKVMPG